MNQPRDHQIVEYHGNNFIFPRCFARKRTKKDFQDKFAMGCLLVGVGCYMTTIPKFEFLLNSTALCYEFQFVQELLSRICSLREENSHLESRYNKSLLLLLKKSFWFNMKTYCGLFYVAVIQTSLLQRETIAQYIDSAGITPVLFCFAGVKLFTDIMEMDESSIKIAKIIDRMKGLDYGSGMAINFFYGYLERVVPGLRERIENFAAKHNVIFATTKLFIFLPLSGRCPANAAEYSPHGILEQSEIVEPVVLNRGGVRNRDYHNTVYKLRVHDGHDGPKEKRRERRLYLCAEFASALQTFYEVRRNMHFVTAVYNEHAQEIITNFYMTLQQLINERDYTNLCELVFFQDRDENGQLLYQERPDGLDLGDLLLRRLNIPQ